MTATTSTPGTRYLTLEQAASIWSRLRGPQSKPRPSESPPPSPVEKR